MVTCAACGQQNPEVARFCLACGRPVERGDPLRAEERRTVTVLFCDLVGFTAASDGADPEDVRARIRPYHSRLRRELELHGGTVEKFIGDAVMAVFGAPIAHEDDAERAVRAGLRSLDAISELNTENAGLDLRVRIGIETGEAIVTLGAQLAHGEGTVIGDIVNTASRLQGVAPVNGVAVGPEAYEATKAIFDYETLAPVALKGKAQPVAIYRAKAARSRLGTDLTRSMSTPMIGRQIDLGILTGAFQKAVQESTVQLVTIVGEPGVGKSRLVAELLEFVQQWPALIRWRQGRCLAYGEGATFWALGEIVKAEAGILETDPPELVVSKLEATVPDSYPDAPWLRQRLRALVGLDAPDAARDENFAAWRTFLQLLADARPSVFVFEDLHWADAALLDFLEHVAKYAVAVPMLVAATARPVLYEQASTWAAGARAVMRVNLSPLSEAETARLIGNLLGSAVLPAEMQQTILERSGGVPLYAEEYVRLLKDRNVLTMRGNTWGIDVGREIGLPSGIQALIAARLDTLPPQRKRLLQDAAVMGKVFWSGALEEMADEDPVRVLDALHELSRRELVRPARQSSMAGQSEYAFTHALVREVCYAQIPRAQRSERHRRAAAWIEKIAAGRLEDHAEILAAHYTTALELAPAGSPAAPNDLSSQALRYLILAGDRALGIDVQAAEQHYQRALAMVPAEDRRRAEILVRYADALQQRARLTDAAHAFEQAIELFRARREMRAAAAAISRYKTVLYQLGDTRYPHLAKEGLAMLEPLGPSPELIQALTEQAAISFVADEHRDAMAFAERAIRMAAELGLPEPLRALGFSGGARAALGDARGLVDMRRALEAAVDQGLGREAGLLYNNLAEFTWPIDGPRARLELLNQGLAFAERRAMEEWMLVLSAQSLEALVDVGSLADAAALTETLLERIESTGDWNSLLVARLARARVLVRRGELEQAAPIAEWAIEQSRKNGDPQEIARAFPLAAGVKVGVGDTQGGVRLLAELEQTPNIRDTPLYAANLPDAVRAAIDAAEPQLAAQLIGGVEPLYPLHQHALPTVQALLAEQRGDYAAAAALFADVTKRWADFEIPWERSHALLGQGRCLLALGRLDEAEAPLRAARELFASLGAQTALADTDSLLQQASAQPGAAS